MTKNGEEVAVDVEYSTAEFQYPLPSKQEDDSHENEPFLEHSYEESICDTFNYCLETCSVLICLTSAGAAFVIITTNVISIVLIAMGSFFYYDCPLNRFIPIAILGQGVIHILQVSLKYWGVIAKKYSVDSEAYQDKSWPQKMLGYVSMGWFITGSVQVYMLYEPNYEPSMAADYCDKGLYLFAFWYYTLLYVILGVFLLLVTCVEIFRKLKYLD